MLPHPFAVDWQCCSSLFLSRKILLTTHTSAAPRLNKIEVDILQQAEGLYPIGITRPAGKNERYMESAFCRLVEAGWLKDNSGREKDECQHILMAQTANNCTITESGRYVLNANISLFTPKWPYHRE